jgi:hypothetical protein
MFNSVSDQSDKDSSKVQWMPINEIAVNGTIRLMLSDFFDFQRPEDVISSSLTINCVWLLFSFG